MGYESIHAAAAEGDDQELRKRVEGLDVDRSNLELLFLRKISVDIFFQGRVIRQKRAKAPRRHWPTSWFTWKV